MASGWANVLLGLAARSVGCRSKPAVASSTQKILFIYSIQFIHSVHSIYSKSIALLSWFKFTVIMFVSVDSKSFSQHTLMRFVIFFLVFSTNVFVFLLLDSTRFLNCFIIISNRVFINCSEVILKIDDKNKRYKGKQLIWWRSA